MNNRFLLKSIILPLSILSGSIGNAQNNKDAVLMIIGDTKVSVREFENVYHKNNTTATIKDEKSLEEYVDLFVNFKLKVKEAEEFGLDTVSSFIRELAGYRKQLSQPYLTDKDVNEKLLKETYDRLKIDVKASHILVKCAENASPKDTLAAYARIMEIRKRILKGENFNKVASEKGISDDPSAKDNGGNLGYFSALQMVYPFETAAYETKVNEISMPIRTRFGFHIIKVDGTRKARGEVLVAHIMVKTPVDLTKEDSITANTKITEIYNKLKAGEKFEDMAKQFSDDKASAKKGGKLPWFGTNKMPVTFENTSFSINNVGEYSLPMQTQYGWHIIKLLNKKTLAPFEEMKGDLKAKVSKDSRSQVGRSSLVAKLKIEYAFKENKKMREEFYKIVDSSYFSATWDKAKASFLNKVMFNLNDKTYTQQDFSKYIATHQRKGPIASIEMIVDGLFEMYVNESVVAYEESRLGEKYPAFKALMQEYRDGILLFELTDQKVWSKAIKDTVGARAFYEKNKGKYLWDERAEVSIYSCINESIAKQTRKLLKRNKTEKEILLEVNESSQLNLRVESGLFTKGENELVDDNWTPEISENIVSKTDKKIKIVVVSKLLKPTTKSYKDSKGMVTSDYQTFLEKQWIKELKGKFAVTIDKSVLATVK